MSDTYLLVPMGVRRSSTSVILSACLMCVYVCVCTITQKRMIPKCSNLVQGMNLGYPTDGMILGSKGQG